MATVAAKNDVGPAFSNIPVPDPTSLTTQQLIATVDALKDLMNEKINGIRSVIETRLEGMDKALELLQEMSNMFPARIDEKIKSLEQVHEEKFSSIRQQFIERDVRTEQTARDSKVAVDAALQAAKEAVGEQNKSSALSIAKSETSTGKQIDQLQSLMTTGTKATDDKIDDIKERLTRIEGHRSGIGDGWGYLVGAVGLIGGVVAVVLAVMRY